MYASPSTLVVPLAGLVMVVRKAQQVTPAGTGRVTVWTVATEPGAEAEARAVWYTA